MSTNSCVFRSRQSNYRKLLHVCIKMTCYCFNKLILSLYINRYMRGIFKQSGKPAKIDSWRNSDFNESSQVLSIKPAWEWGRGEPILVMEGRDGQRGWVI